MSLSIYGRGVYQLLRNYYYISHRVIKERGYDFVSDEESAQRFGISESIPGLLIPCLSTRGKSEYYVYCPKEFCFWRERIICDPNHQTPYNNWVVSQKHLVDCPPSCFQDIINSSKTLYIADNQRLSDSLVSRGLCSITVRNLWFLESSGQEALDYVKFELEPVNFTNREVRFVGDNEVLSDPWPRINPYIIKNMIRQEGVSFFSFFFPRYVSNLSYGYLEDDSYNRKIERIPKLEIPSDEDLLLAESTELHFIICTAVARIASIDFYSRQSKDPRRKRFVIPVKLVIDEVRYLVSQTGDNELRRILNNNRFIRKKLADCMLYIKASYEEKKDRWICYFKGLSDLLGDMEVSFPDETQKK